MSKSLKSKIMQIEDKVETKICNKVAYRVRTKTFDEIQFQIFCLGYGMRWYIGTELIKELIKENYE